MNGTLVRLFPQTEGFDEPVVVVLSSPAGSVAAGPADATLRTVLPVDKRAPYEPPNYMPPYRGAALPPAAPDPWGNFDTVPVDCPQFLCQHLFGGIRRTLDVWEGYLGRPVVWWHAPQLPQLELVPMLDWDNAHSGPGFIETGVRATQAGVPQLFALNFDVIAHETGHAILFSEVGAPALSRMTAGYLAFQESFSDLIALIAALRFPQVVDRMLAETGGNLYVLNLVSRIGEMSKVEQIRVADNEVTVADLADLSLTEDGEWVDHRGLGRTVHHASLPLTGAVFDVLVDLYQDNLVRAGVIPPRLDARGWDESEVHAAFDSVATRSAEAFARRAGDFRRALAGARDAVGLCMARTMRTIDAEDLTFDAVAAGMIRAAAELGIERIGPAFLENFLWRGIDPRPLLAEDRKAAARWRRLSYVERRTRIATLTDVRRRAHASIGACAMAGKMIQHPQRTLEIGPRKM